MFKITLFLLFASCAYFGVDAIKCYNCDSSSDPTCEDPNASTPSVECITNTPTDYKIKMFDTNYTITKADTFECYSVKAELSGVSEIVRGCVATNIAGRFCNAFEDSIEAIGGKVNYCGTCTTDLCNSAEVTVVPIKCYNCDSYSDPTCEDPSADTPSVECTDYNRIKIFDRNYTNTKAITSECYNAKAKVSGLSNIVRGCDTSIIAGGFCKSYESTIETIGGKVIYCGTCATDLCNSAKGLQIHLYTSIFCLFAALFASRLL